MSEQIDDYGKTGRARVSVIIQNRRFTPFAVVTSVRFQPQYGRKMEGAIEQHPLRIVAFVRFWQDMVSTKVAQVDSVVQIGMRRGGRQWQDGGETANSSNSVWSAIVVKSDNEIEIPAAQRQPVNVAIACEAMSNSIFTIGKASVSSRASDVLAPGSVHEEIDEIDSVVLSWSKNGAKKTKKNCIGSSRRHSLPIRLECWTQERRRSFQV
jgi:hypothetical protein